MQTLRLRKMQLLTLVGTLASLWGLGLAYILSANPSTVWIIIIVVVLALLTFALVAEEIKAQSQVHVFDLRKGTQSKDAIATYMCSWVNRGGRVVIFSRDLTWVSEKRNTKEILISKAKSAELTICLPRRNSVSDELEHHGASIIDYKEIDLIPSARFTIINYGRANAQVAIARQTSEFHIIEEFSITEHPSYAAMVDFIAVLEQYRKYIDGLQKTT